MRFAIVQSLRLLLLAIVLPSAAGAQAVDKTKIWNANKQAVVKLMVTGLGPEGTPNPALAGSGVILGSNGTIVTALAVVGRDEEWYEESGRRDRKVEVIALDERGIEESLGQASVTPVPTLNIAVLNITGSGLAAASVGKDRPDEVASVVAILWEPDSSQPEPVSADLVPTDRGRYGDLLTVQMAVVPGLAGAGLFDAAGELVGVITNQIRATKVLAVPSDRFAQFLTRTMIMRYAIVRLLALLLAVIVPAAAAAQAVDKTKIWNANKQAVVKLKVSGRNAAGSAIPVRTGSGVIVRSNGTIVTALHVVGRDEEWFEEAGRRDRKVEVIGLDERGIEESLGQASVTPVPTLDVAILYITATGLPAATLAEERPGEFASVVGILWDPDSRQPQAISADLLLTDKGEHGDLLTVQMAVVPGHSGSGLFDAAGKLVGVITNQRGATKALAVPFDRFSHYLPKLPPEDGGGGNDQKEKPAAASSATAGTGIANTGEQNFQGDVIIGGPSPRPRAE